MEAKVINKFFQPAARNSYYALGSHSVGLYVKNKKATLIDSGIGPDSAQKINNNLKANNLILKAIINTHSHADHCSNNSFFQKEYPNLKIYSTSYEKAFIEHPKMEAIGFCNGAKPFAALRNKFLEAPASIVTNVISPYQDQIMEIDADKFNIITLPGHTPGMIGVITEDNILYCGDALFGHNTFAKHGILFYTNIADTLKTLIKLSTLKIDNTVFYHGGLANENIASITKKHTEKIIETKKTILWLINQRALSIDELTEKVLNYYEIKKDIIQFTLTRTCVNSYISYLESEKEIVLVMDDGILKVKGTSPYDFQEGYSI